jgi:hypothetical protein
MCACESSARKAEEADGLETGEVKVTLAETPPAVRKAIERELVGAKLEDIAKKEQHGATVYETDIEKNGERWEIIFGEDGRTISKHEEEGDEEGESDEQAEGGDGWRDHFAIEKADLAAIGGNKWLAIQPGRVLKLRHGADTLTITILSDAPTVDGVKVGVLEERETKAGKLIEVSRNFFATSKTTGDVYYFGEDVDNYKDGQIENHASEWRSGEKGARFGLMVPGAPKTGDKYYQEIAPHVAMDRVEIVSTDETVKTPAGTFEHCLHLKETTPLEKDVSHKWYAPGVGMIKDDDFELAEKAAPITTFTSVFFRAF